MSYIPLLNIAPISGPFRWPGEIDTRKWFIEAPEQSAIAAKKERRQYTDNLILEAMGSREIGAMEIADELYLPQNVVTGRMRALFRMGEIVRASNREPYRWRRA